MVEYITDPSILAGIKPNSGNASHFPNSQYITDPDIIAGITSSNTGKSKIESTLRGLEQGLTFGFGDELNAGLESIVSDKTYDQAVAESRNNMAAAKSQNPISYEAGNVIGSIAPVALGVASGGSLPALMGLGAAAGAMRGAGDATSIEGIPSEAISGAIVGGATGAMGPAIGSIGKGLSAAAPIAGKAVDWAAGQVTNSHVPFVGDLAKGGVEKITQLFINKGMAPDVAQHMANRLLLSGGGMGLPIPGSGAISHGILGVDTLGKPVGNMMQGIGRKFGEKTTLGGTATFGGNETGDQVSVNNTNTVSSQIRPVEAMKKSQGTKFQRTIQEANARGPESMNATLFILSQNSEWRELTNDQFNNTEGDIN